MKIGGIDIGTTGSKLTVYDELGNFLGREYVEYEISRNTGEHEIDGNVIFDGVKEVIKKTAAKIGNIDVIGITSFGETFVMLDKYDNILLPSMLYTDGRGIEEAKTFDEKQVIDIAGVKPNSMYSLPKIMWVKKNKPEIYEKADKILLFEDFIVYMLTGNAVIDRSLAARTMGLDIKTLDWSRELFDFAGVDISKMSKVVKSGNIAGKIKPDMAKELGLLDTVIVNGCHDQVASAVGAGAFSSGEAVDGMGTVECVTPVFDTIPKNKELYDNSYCVVPYVEEGKYVCYAFSFTGGAAAKWYRDNFAKDISYKELDSKVDDKVGEILCLPHFAGAATPYMDAGSKAAFLGVTLETKKEDLYKAILEGVAYETLINLKELEKSKIAPKKLYATGGGANSRVWLQIKADIMGLPITPIDAPEVGALGTIMLAGVSVGAFSNLNEAKSVMVKEKDTIYPNSEKHNEYMKQFAKYEKIYKAVRPIME
ncbi:MAG: carbohydrate kinase [Firmicutes bacterium]|nr:carbohydrate kinase [Bacillota bacterium]